MEYKYDDIAKFLKENGIKYEIGNGKNKKTMYEMPTRPPLHFRVIKLSDDGTKAEVFPFIGFKNIRYVEESGCLVCSYKEITYGKDDYRDFYTFDNFSPNNKIRKSRDNRICFGKTEVFCFSDVKDIKGCVSKYYADHLDSARIQIRKYIRNVEQEISRLQADAEEHKKALCALA